MNPWKTFGKLFKPEEHPLPENISEHAVTIHFLYGIDSLDPLHTLERRLDEIISKNNVCQYDWHEIAMDNSHGTLFMYGPNAERLFLTVQPLLKETSFMKGAIAYLRFGPPGNDVPGIEVEIN